MARDKEAAAEKMRAKQAAGMDSSEPSLQGMLTI
jgi:hypothetical protein